MPDGAFILFLPFELEHQNLLAAPFSRYRAGDGAVPDLGARQQFAALSKNRQNLGKLNLGADVARQLGDADHFSRGNPILFSAGFNNGMHWEILDWEPNRRKMLGLMV